MSRLVIAALLLVPALAAAEPARGDDTSDLGDQGIGVAIGAASGGRVTPGGLRITGHYLYQLSDEDWFDGTASFTYGGGGAACFRDRMALLVCDHGLAQGAGIELAASVRRVFDPRGQFRPFARAGVGVSLVRFSDDKVSGVAFPLHLGGGMRTTVAPKVAIVIEGELVLGLGVFNQGLGAEPQLGLALAAGAEFTLE